MIKTYQNMPDHSKTYQNIFFYSTGPPMSIRMRPPVKFGPPGACDKNAVAGKPAGNAEWGCMEPHDSLRTSAAGRPQWKNAADYL